MNSFSNSLRKLLRTLQLKGLAGWSGNSTACRPDRRQVPARVRRGSGSGALQGGVQESRTNQPIRLGAITRPGNSTSGPGCYQANCCLRLHGGHILGSGPQNRIPSLPGPVRDHSSSSLQHCTPIDVRPSSSAGTQLYSYYRDSPSGRTLWNLLPRPGRQEE